MLFMRASRRRLRLFLLRAFASLAPPPGQAAESRFSLVGEERPRILLVRPDHIGDVLFATPALSALREAFPKAHIAGMVGPWAKAVLEHNRNLDEIIVCEFPGFTRRPKASLIAPYRLLREWARRLRAMCFDMAIILRFDHWWGALLAYVAGIPCRLGYAIPECRPFLTQTIPYQVQRHEVQQNLALIAAVAEAAGRALSPSLVTLDYVVREQEREDMARYLAERGARAGERLIAIHPGAGAAVKLWPAESWGELADAIAASWPSRLVITGSREELDLAWAVYAHMRSDAIVAAGDTSLGQLAALYQGCRLVIGPDCGPLHLAVAVGTPTVHLYGPVDASRFGPWGPPDRHVVVTSDRSCIPCNRLDYSFEELADHPCVREITVEAVYAAVQGLLARL